MGRPGDHRASDKARSGSGSIATGDKVPPSPATKGVDEAKSRPYSPAKWFETLFGFAEKPDAVHKYIKVTKDGDGLAVLASEKMSGKQYVAGEFVLRGREIERSVPNPGPGGGKFSIIRADDPSKLRVPAAICRPENDGATWLVASNFNALEFTGPSQTARHGVTGYVHDRTQGPYASLAAGPAIVYRNYFVPHNAKGRDWEGQEGEEVNLLEGTALGRFVRHGYCLIPDAKVANQVKAELGLKKAFRVASHHDLQVTTTQLPSGDFQDVPPGMICHQVFAAALDFAGSVVWCAETREIGHQLLTEEYRLAIYCAWENAERARKAGGPPRQGHNTFHIVMLGGGVFRNPHEDIAKAIYAQKQLIIESGLEVCIGEMAALPPLLEQLRQETSGRVIKW